MKSRHVGLEEVDDNVIIIAVSYIRGSTAQGCANPGIQVAVATKFSTVAPIICGFSALNSLHVTLLAPRILRWLLEFWKICAPLL